MQSDVKFISCCNLDWLSLIYIIPEIDGYSLENFKFSSVPGYYVEKLAGTNVWQFRFIIYDKTGRKLMTWLCFPKSSMLSASFSLVEFANSTLYSGEWVKLVDLLPSFVNGYIHGLSRLDLCLDFQYCYDESQNLVSAASFCSRLLSSELYVSGKRKGAAFFDFVEDQHKIACSPVQISWGSKTSSFKWKLYNKSREIRDKQAELCKAKSSKIYKPYIQKMWQAVGFVGNLDIWRLECSIVSANSISLQNVANEEMLDISYLKDRLHVCELFRYLQVNKFSVRVNDGCINKFNNRLIEPFGWKFGDWSVSRKVLSFAGNRKTPVYYVRSLVNVLEDKIFLLNCDFRENILSQIESVLNMFDLFAWFKSSYQMSFFDYKASILNSCEFRSVPISEDYQKEIEINLFTNLKN